MDPAGQDVDRAVRRGRALLGRAVRAAWEGRLLTKDPDGLFSGMLAAPEVQRLLELGDAPPPPADEPLPDGSPRVAALARTASAGDAAEDLLSACVAVELDGGARALAGYLRGNSLGSALTVGTLGLALGPARAAALLAAVGAGAPLRRYLLIEVVDRSAETGASATVRAAPRLTRWLLGGGRLAIDAEAAPLARLELPDAPPLSDAAVTTLAPLTREVESFLRAHSGGAPSDLVLRGPRGAGRGEVVRQACRALGLPVLASSLDRLLAAPDLAEAAGTLLREALLLGAQLVIESWDDLAGQEAASQRLRAALASSPGPVVMTTAGDQPPRLPGRVAVTIDVPVAAAAERAALWPAELPGAEGDRLASLYRVGVGAIRRSAERARLHALVRGDGAVTAGDIAAAVRGEFETDLGTVATRVTVSQTWDDLVAFDDTKRVVREIVDQLRHRATVLGRWGFQRKLGRGVGTTALFSGEPGTGKTMVAGLIARELGLELYRIDLSRVMSKWIGETEKNLSRLFDAAEVGHVVLLFDEADSLLAKRTADPKSSNDRYSNVETNYVLQRIEEFQGCALLTSNMEGAIDPAMSRRLSFEVRFPFPDEEQRAELWRRMLPKELPVEGTIDFKALATRFEIAGGRIRNIVLRAAYLAARDGASLTQAHLLRAAEHEYHDRGMLVAKGRLA